MHAAESPTGSPFSNPDDATRRFIGTAIRADIREGDPQFVDLCAHREWLARNGLLPVLARALRNRTVTIDASLRAAMDDAARRLAARELAIATPLREALAALASARIDVLIFKGEALATQVYDEPGVRERGDVDAWVAEHEFDRADAALRAGGFDVALAADGHEVQTERTYVHRRVPQLAIDLHRRAFGQGLLDAALPFDSVWSRAEPHGDSGARRPDAADALIIAALHRRAHHADGSDRALWLYDCDLLVRRFPEALESAATRAQARHVGALLGDTLRSARAMFDTPIETSTLERLDACAPHEISSALLRPMSPLRRALLDFRSLRGVSARARFLREHLFPSRAFVRARFPGAPAWAWPLLYPWRIVVGIGRALRR